MIKAIKRFLRMIHIMPSAFTTRLIMKSGVTVKVRCKEFSCKIENNEILEYKFTGNDPGQAMYINIGEIAAIQTDYA